MRITIRYESQVVDERTFLPCRAKPLDGQIISEEELASHLDRALAIAGIVGGEVRFEIAGDSLWTAVTFWAPLRLDACDVDALVANTTGQLADGVGEDGFDVATTEGTVVVIPNVDKRPTVEQFDDGTYVPGPNKIAVASQYGDVEALIREIAQHPKEIDRRFQGYTPLHLSIIHGHVDAALCLIDHGANVNELDISGLSPLVLCALTSALPDDGSARIAQMIVDRGGNSSCVGPAGQTVKELARLRHKYLLEAVF